MLAIPTWMLALLVFAIFVLFAILIEVQGKLKNLMLQSIINAQATSEGFEDIAVDIDGIVRTVDRLEAINDYKESKE